MKIKGKIAIVTGASSGIGKATARSMAKKGATLGLVARSRNKLQDLKDELTIDGTNVHIYPCDVSEPKQVRAAYLKIVEEIGIPDILINSAGIGIWKPFMEISDEEHAMMMNVNYWGSFYWIRNVLPDMLKGGHKRIINISSGSGKIGFASTSGYSASKFAVTGLSESLHRELLFTKVGVSCIHPGSVQTAFWDDERIPSKHIPALIKYSPKLSPKAIAREVNYCIWFGNPTRTTPIFLALLVRINAIWIILGDLMIWKWFFPLLVLFFLVKVGLKYFL